MRFLASGFTRAALIFYVGNKGEVRLTAKRLLSLYTTILNVSLILPPFLTPLLIKTSIKLSLPLDPTQCRQRYLSQTSYSEGLGPIKNRSRQV
jgi:hypothetical protein